MKHFKLILNSHEDNFNLVKACFIGDTCQADGECPAVEVCAGSSSDSTGCLAAADMCFNGDGGGCGIGTDLCYSDGSTCTLSESCITDSNGDCWTNDGCLTDNGGCSIGDSCTTDSSTCSIADICAGTDNSGGCWVDICLLNDY